MIPSQPGRARTGVTYGAVTGTPQE
jgi:hypothetical protein